MRLTAAQDPGGGWGWLPGRPPTTECTALALMALPPRDEQLEDVSARAAAWLRARQQPDGSWPMSDQAPGGSWMTALAVLALARSRQPAPEAVAGAQWLLARRSRGRSLLARLVSRLAAQEPVVDQDPDLRGWPWTADTTAWVEPTAWSLLAVKRMRPHVRDDAADDRIRHGELLLADRICEGGGWNYGNRRVMGEALEPYPDTTALALLALQDARSEDVTGVSLRRLDDLVQSQPSTLVLALAILCLRAYGRDTAGLRQALGQRIQDGRSPDLRALALATLALDESGSALELQAA
jgi:hypothetical protein